MFLIISFQNCSLINYYLLLLFLLSLLRLLSILYFSRWFKTHFIRNGFFVWLVEIFKLKLLADINIDLLIQLLLKDFPSQELSFSQKLKITQLWWDLFVTCNENLFLGSDEVVSIWIGDFYLYHLEHIRGSRLLKWRCHVESRKKRLLLLLRFGIDFSQLRNEVSCQINEDLVIEIDYTLLFFLFD